MTRKVEAAPGLEEDEPEHSRMFDVVDRVLGTHGRYENLSNLDNPFDVSQQFEVGAEVADLNTNTALSDQYVCN